MSEIFFFVLFCSVLVNRCRCFLVVFFFFCFFFLDYNVCCIFYSRVSKSSDEGRKYSMTEWVVFASVCIVMIINVSVVHAFGTLFPHMLSEFGGSRASTATVQSVLFGVGLCSG